MTETLARLGIYQLPSSLPPYPDLLSLALDRRTVLDSVVLIALDWEKPWNFVTQLRKWIYLLETVLSKTGVLDQWEGAEARERGQCSETAAACLASARADGGCHLLMVAHR